LLTSDIVNLKPSEILKGLIIFKVNTPSQNFKEDKDFRRF